jgi:hypothetical protein
VTVDGREETRDVIVLPERIARGWWRKEGHGLVLEDLDEVPDAPVPTSRRSGSSSSTDARGVHKLGPSG